MPASHDWFETKWREFCQPITKRSKIKPKQTCKYFRHSTELTENRSMSSKFDGLIKSLNDLNVSDSVLYTLAFGDCRQATFAGDHTNIIFHSYNFIER